MNKLCTSLKCEVLFSSIDCLVLDTTNKNKIGSATMNNDLYHLHVTDFNTLKISNTCTSFSVVCNPSNLWHFRLGHPYNKTIAMLKSSFADISVDSDFVCDTCHKCKQKKLSFYNSQPVTLNIFDLVHIDILGPTLTSIEGYKYFVTVVDDFSRFT